MADGEGGGTKILRGLVIAVIIVAAIILLAVFWSQALDALAGIGNYIVDHIPAPTGQRVSVLVYLILAVVLGILFSKAGHFTAYGVVMGLGPLLWFLFWKGFPLLGLSPSWIGSMGLDPLTWTEILVFAAVADLLITLVFVPLELREKFHKRKHRLGDPD